MVDVAGRIFGAMDCGKSPTPIIIAAGESCGNPGIPGGIIPGGLGRKEDAGEGGSFVLFEDAIEEGVLTVALMEDNPVNEKHVFRS